MTYPTASVYNNPETGCLWLSCNGVVVCLLSGSGVRRAGPRNLAVQESSLIPTLEHVIGLDIKKKVELVGPRIY
jgi:hypothetical protein